MPTKTNDTNSHPSVKNKLNSTLCEQECKLLDTLVGASIGTITLKNNLAISGKVKDAYSTT